MFISELGTKRLAVLVSGILHIVLLTVALPERDTKLKAKPKEYFIPVQLSMTKPAPPKKKVTTKQKRRPSKRYGAKKVAKPKTPTRLPGDRDLPQVRSSVKPIYPKSALNYGWEGTVKATFYVDAQGKPNRFKILSSSGHDLLDRSFVNTVMTYYSFDPKRVMGKNTPGSITLSHTFDLSDDT